MATDNELSFPINQALLDDANKLKQERGLVRERLDKIEAKKNDVSPSVYQKVKQEYVQKLNEATNALLEKKGDIDKELSTLYETRSRITESLEQHKEVLEELKFRHELGEHDDANFTSLSNDELDKIGKFEKVLGAVSGNIDRYKAIFEDEEGFVESAEPSIKKQKTKPTKQATTPNLLEGSDYNIETEGEDYFAPEEDASRTPSESSIDITKKTAAETSTPSGAARLIIIEGGHVNQEYKLRKETTIGRANSNTIILKDGKVSRQHAVVKQTGNEYVMLDLNSSNGVIVNHERVKEHVLSDGDQIAIGDHTLQFKL
ncbi:MAG: hypothetical protein COV46_07425 [Deltaproteobacteria bacterium CG11_big_fil_rev_8_21_14_0_20_49_13]|nr:MAG: hypothetical protein COV46_07425 [Deltaproteobacteria bacterium CG11_big_fil_rev_8_21_14_0_20_49_13]